jgi:aspartate/methionine/tyrosine aminotransferase
VFLATDREQDHQVTATALRRKLTKRTRMLLICSPHNPTGTLLGKASLAEIGTELDGSRVIVLADEIYKKLTYAGSTFIAPASLSDDMAARTITVGGFSKAYAMDGWRLGYFASSAETARHALKVKQLLTVCNPVFLQHGAVAALRGSDEELQRTTAEYQRRRDALMNQLADQSIVSTVAPGGAFYLYLRYPSEMPGAVAVADLLLQQEGVAVVPGSAFGAGQGHHLRISYSAPADDVTEGMQRILRTLSDASDSSRN